MNRRMMTLFAAVALAGFGCGDDDGTGTMTSDDMGTTPMVDMGTTTDDDMGTTPGDDMGTTGDDMGTSSRAPEDALSDIRDLNEQLAELDCECDMGNFESVAACVAFDDSPAAYLTCEEMAYADNVAAQGASSVCFADALEAYASCSDDAACGETALDACFETFFAAAQACPEGADAYFSAVASCVATHITGDPAESCPDETLSAGTVGDSVADGSTLTAGSDFVLSCDDGGAPDVAIAWTAPTTASYVLDTVGSDYDTALAVFDSCTDGTELACNDDSEGTDIGLLSELTLEATEGTTYIIVVGGYDELSAGGFVLNINEAPEG